MRSVLKKVIGEASALSGPSGIAVTTPPPPPDTKGIAGLGGRTHVERVTGTPEEQREVQIADKIARYVTQAQLDLQGSPQTQTVERWLSKIAALATELKTLHED